MAYREVYLAKVAEVKCAKSGSAKVRGERKEHLGCFCKLQYLSDSFKTFLLIFVPMNLPVIVL